MSSFILKIIAVISMCFDHVGICLTHGIASFWNYIGRLAFPIFAFQISEGYIHTSNLKKYFGKLFVFALISQIPFNFFEYALGFSLGLNVLFTLFLGLLSITIFDKAPNKILGFIGVAICVILGDFFKVDYGYWGVLVVFCFYLFKNNKLIMSLIYLLLVIVKYINGFITSGFYYQYIALAIGTYLSIIPILLYNGKQGPKTKYLLYIFYPLHLIILGILYFTGRHILNWLCSNNISCLYHLFLILYLKKLFFQIYVFLAIPSKQDLALNPLY